MGCLTPTNSGVHVATYTQRRERRKTHCHKHTQATVSSWIDIFLIFDKSIHNLVGLGVVVSVLVSLSEGCEFKCHLGQVIQRKLIVWKQKDEWMEKVTTQSVRCNYNMRHQRWRDGLMDTHKQRYTDRHTQRLKCAPQWASIIISTLEQLHNSWHWVSVNRAFAISRKQGSQSILAHQSAVSLSVYIFSLPSFFATTSFPLGLFWMSY